MSPRRANVAGEAAREKILAAALAVFAERGFFGGSVRAVAARADMAPTSLLHHYGDKRKLYRAVLDAINASLERALTPATSDAAEGATSGAATEAINATTTVDTLCEALVEWTFAHPDGTRIMLRELLERPAPTASDAALPAHWPLRPVVRRVVAWVERGQRRGQLRADVDPILFLVHLVGSVSYFYAARTTLAHVAERSLADLDADYRASVRVLARTLLLPSVDSSVDSGDHAEDRT